jgi:DNA topoisomerase-2
MAVDWNSKIVKLSPLEHVLARPDSYVGSVETSMMPMWVAESMEHCINHEEDTKSELVIRRDVVHWNAALYKIVDELIVNALDHAVRTQGLKAGMKMTRIELTVNLDVDKPFFEITNNGEGIAIETHQEYGSYHHELVFGELMTGTNFDDLESRTIGGRNGLGCKLSNIFSRRMEVVGVDSTRKKTIMLVFENNMTTCQRSFGTYAKGTKDSTTVRIWPDWSRFVAWDQSIHGADMLRILHRRALDAAMLAPPHVEVVFNGTVLGQKTLSSYVSSMFVRSSSPPQVVVGTTGTFQYAVFPLDQLHPSDAAGSLFQLSFVNGIHTLEGGTYVDSFLQHLTNDLHEWFVKKFKTETVQKRWIRDQLGVVVVGTVTNPTFDSQSKNKLMTKTTVPFQMTPKVNIELQRWSVWGTLLGRVQEKEDKKSSEVKRTRGMLTGIPHLSDAPRAGTKDWKQCKLFLVEGLSARTACLSGFTALPETERPFYGVYALRGKCMNTRDAPLSAIMNNTELQQIKQILGVPWKTTGEVTLRYGQVVFFTDQDLDGFHIRGLLLNLFDTLWPHVMHTEGSLHTFQTPLVKVFRGGEIIHEFLDQDSFQAWQRSPAADAPGLSIKYYKGLGTSNQAEAQSYFRQLPRFMQVFTIDPGSTEALSLAFDKTKSDQRKEWIQKFEGTSSSSAPSSASSSAPPLSTPPPPSQLVPTNTSKKKRKQPEPIAVPALPPLSVSQFVHGQLVQFSYYNVCRSIPSAIDGLKLSQRKILYTCLKHGYYKDIKVSQLAGQVMADTAYHHGETSLHSTIIGMAQQFVGSNNVSLLRPSGQFGSRLEGGQDAAAARYLHTSLMPYNKLLFHAHDLPLLKYLEDDGKSIEPQQFVPLLPMVLVNGAEGIATGFSCYVPPHRPKDLVDNLRRFVNDEPLVPMTPWFRGFKGAVTVDGATIGIVGCWERVDQDTIRITELPIGTWTSSYEESLKKGAATSVRKSSSQAAREKILKVIRHDDVEKVHIDVVFEDKSTVDEMIKANEVEKVLKLETNVYTSNMYLFDSQYRIKRYQTTLDILVDAATERVALYQRRREHLLKVYRHDLLVLTETHRFLGLIVQRVWTPFHKPKTQWITELSSAALHFAPLGVEWDSDASWDYLFHIRLDQYTTERMSDLESKMEKKTRMLQELESMSASALFLRDLDEWDMDAEAN